MRREWEEGSQHPGGGWVGPPCSKKMGGLRNAEKSAKTYTNDFYLLRFMPEKKFWGIRTPPLDPKGGGGLAWIPTHIHPPTGAGRADPPSPHTKPTFISYSESPTDLETVRENVSVLGTVKGTDTRQQLLNNP